MTLQQTVSAENQTQKPHNTMSYFRFLLKNNWQQLALCGVLCFLIVFLPILLSTSELGVRDELVGDSSATQLSYEETVAKRAETQMETLGVLFVLTAGVVGVIFGMTANGYTNTKPSIHTYYSYPLRRDTLFVAEWLTRDLYFLLTGTVFYLLSALLTNSSDVASSLLSHSQACNPFKKVSTFGITLINLFLNVTSGYWMAYRIRNEKVNEPDVESVQTDKEEGAVSIPDEGEIPYGG